MKARCFLHLLMTISTTTASIDQCNAFSFTEGSLPTAPRSQITQSLDALRAGNDMGRRRINGFMGSSAHIAKIGERSSSAPESHGQSLTKRSPAGGSEDGKRNPNRLSSSKGDARLSPPPKPAKAKTQPQPLASTSRQDRSPSTPNRSPRYQSSSSGESPRTPLKTAKVQQIPSQQSPGGRSLSQTHFPKMEKPGTRLMSDEQWLSMNTALRDAAKRNARRFSMESYRPPVAELIAAQRKASEARDSARSARADVRSQERASAGVFKSNPASSPTAKMETDKVDTVRKKALIATTIHAGMEEKAGALAHITQKYKDEVGHIARSSRSQTRAHAGQAYLNAWHAQRKLLADEGDIVDDAREYRDAAKRYYRHMRWARKTKEAFPVKSDSEDSERDFSGVSRSPSPGPR